MDDLISRQAAIDAILHNQEVYSNNFGDNPIDKYTIAIIDNDAQTIAQLPSAQTERKKGKWIEHERAEEAEGCLISNYECSCCHTWERKNSDYCPNCGAEMGGEQK